MALEGKYTQFVHGDWKNEGEYNIADDQTFRGSFDGSSGEDIITYHTSWQNAKDFCQGLMGFAEVDNQMIGGLSRELPQRHPYWPSMYCQHVNITGRGIDPDRTFTNSYGTCSIPEYAEIVAYYRPPPYRVKADDQIGSELERFISRPQPKFTVDYVSGGTNKLKSVLNNAYISDSAPPARLPTLSKTLIWHGIPTSKDDPYFPDNWDVITNAVGKINEVSFDGHPAGTCLLENVTPVQKMPNPLDNRWNFDLVFDFKVRDIRDTLNGVLYGGLNFWDGTKGGTGIIVGVRDVDNHFDWLGWNSYWMPKSDNFPPIFTYFTFEGTRTGEPYYKLFDMNDCFTILPD